MSEIIPIGLDLAKNVFQEHGADGAGRAVLRKKIRRAQVLKFFSRLPSCGVAMKACGGAHFLGREIGKLGHDVRLIPPAYVKPFVKRQKNDMADAEAICEAAMRPTMRFVPVKSEETQKRGNGLSRARASDPAAHASHQCLARPFDRVRSDRAPGSGQRIKAGRPHRGSGE
jgi:transposase